ncbi:Glyco_hydro_20 domain-containing protein/Glyco_hydro_20b domain-containing protein [Cephalotus follicularis]|uniref:Beta-hexosaminidase n=1 Tax=Cephalotus follicularis TaxID=3775 RepID=A0A1Q3CA09_CEPFO|nr:Glyco_hydro_20 domain-containing protein/Glyco_hydro_20b domain-containing protein [Cephalotus follicularis]
MPLNSPKSLAILTIFILLSISQTTTLISVTELDESLTYIWPLPTEFTSGNETLSVDPGLLLSLSFKAGNSYIIEQAFERYKSIIFKHINYGLSVFSYLRGRTRRSDYDITKLSIVVDSDSEELQLGVDESYALFVAKNEGQSIIAEATIEAKTVYGALRGLETFSQLCAFDYGTKTVQIYKAPWYIQDKPRFTYRGLMLDTARHYLPIDVIKQIIESMSYAKFNVLHWHIIDEQSFPLEVPTYPNLWDGAYTKWERYTVEDAREIVSYAKMRGINVMAEVDVPGHAESWGRGYPDLWPSTSCREPLDVSKNFTFDLLSGLLTDLRKIFPFELFHLGGDEVNTDCWNSTPSVKHWLQDHKMTPKDAYQYFVLRAQEIAISNNWTPVNWEETFNAFATNLNPRTIVHNWLGSGVCPKAVAKGFRCIFSNQGVWYLDHLDVPWDKVYTAEPLEGIISVSQQALVLGGEVCMWAETADPSNVLQTIWPRAAAAAERLWSRKEAISTGNFTLTALPRLHNFRCLLNRRGIQAAPVTNKYARTPPIGPGSCYEQ